MPVSLAAQEEQQGWEGRTLAIGRYQWSLPLGDTKEFTDNDSWLGFAIEGRRFIAADLSTSFLAGYTEFHERTDDEDRTLRVIPFMLGGQRYIGRPGGVQAYLGLHFGVYWIRQSVEGGSTDFSAEDVLFGVAPEVGLAIPLRPEVGMIVGTRYEVPFSGGDFLGGAQSFRYWSLGLGLAYVL
jgi:outer membrane protein